MDELTIGEVARLTGVQPTTLRYYEDIGLLPSPQRRSGQRRYTRDILQILAVIQLAKDASFSLPEIHALLYDYSNNTKPSERWKALAHQKIHEIDAIIAHAQEMKNLLEEGLRCDSLLYELDQLPLPENAAPLFEQAEAGD